MRRLARIALVHRQTKEAIRRDVPVALLRLSDDELARSLGFRSDDWTIERRHPDHAGLATVTVIDRRTGLREASKVLPAVSLLGKSNVSVLRELGRDPEKTILVREMGEGRNNLPEAVSSTTFEDDPNVFSPGFDDLRSLIISSAGGLGDNLVATNILRQLVKRLPDECRIGFASRDSFSLFRHIGFVDEWVSPAGTPLSLIDMGWEAILILRYSGHLFRYWERGAAEAYAPSLSGMNAGVFVCDHLPRTLGSLSFEWDGRYLGEHLRSVKPGIVEKARLKSVLPRGSYIVLANGTDASFDQTQTKRLPANLLAAAAERLHQEGHEIVQVGSPGVEKVSCEGSIDLIGKTSLEGLAEVLRGCSGVICGDNGTMHLASQMELDDVPICVAFGPTDPAFWGYPENLNLVASASRCPLRPCWYQENWWHLRCVAERRGLTEPGEYPECMRAFSPDAFAESVTRRIGKPRSESGVSRRKAKP